MFHKFLWPGNTFSQSIFLDQCSLGNPGSDDLPLLSCVSILWFLLGFLGSATVAITWDWRKANGTDPLRITVLVYFIRGWPNTYISISSFWLELHVSLTVCSLLTWNDVTAEDRRKISGGQANSVYPMMKMFSIGVQCHRWNLVAIAKDFLSLSSNQCATAIWYVSLSRWVLGRFIPFVSKGRMEREMIQLKEGKIKDRGI